MANKKNRTVRTRNRPYYTAGESGLLPEHQAILEQMGQSVYRAVSFAMVMAYWEIGRLIVEEEQQGKERAELSRTHYLLLFKVKEEKARLLYMNEAADCGSTWDKLASEVAPYRKCLMSVKY